MRIEKIFPEHLVSTVFLNFSVSVVFFDFFLQFPHHCSDFSDYF